MAQTFFNIFGDHLTRKTVKNVMRQPLSTVGNENMGKAVLKAPIDPNEAIKSIKNGEPKKSFLSNTGKALEMTPRKMFSSRSVNVGPLIYSEENEKGYNEEEFEFTKPTRKFDPYQCELFDIFPEFKYQVSPPSTPPPEIRRQSLELDTSYNYCDEFFTDDFTNDSLPDEDLGLPSFY